MVGVGKAGGMTQFVLWIILFLPNSLPYQTIVDVFDPMTEAQCQDVAERFRPILREGESVECRPVAFGEEGL